MLATSELNKPLYYLNQVGAYLMYKFKTAHLFYRFFARFIVFLMHRHFFFMFYFSKLTYYMAVSAVEQLQVMASKRQYKEAAAQLEVSNLSLQHFCITVVY